MGLQLRSIQMSVAWLKVLPRTTLTFQMTKTRNMQLHFPLTIDLMNLKLIDTSWSSSLINALSGLGF
jgi:hypothetical protein